MTSGTDSLQRHRAAVRARLSERTTCRPGRKPPHGNPPRGDRHRRLGPRHPAPAGASRSGRRRARPQLLPRQPSLQISADALDASAMLWLTFGDTEQMIMAAAGINDSRPVRGRVREGAGEAYSAHDPELQRWVHATLLESIRSPRAAVGPLTLRERDRYCSEAAILEPRCGCRPDGSRGTRRNSTANARHACWREHRRHRYQPALARAGYPPHWYLAWPAFRAMQLLTIGSLPPSIRMAYGFESPGRDERAFARWTSLLRTSLRLLPPLAREWPMARARRNAVPTQSRARRLRKSMKFMTSARKTKTVSIVTTSRPTPDGGRR